MAKILTQRRRVAEVVSTTSGPILTQRRRDAETGRARAPREPITTSGHNAVETGRARAPREPWSRVKLGDVCEVTAGSPAPQEKKLFEKGTHPFIRTSDVGVVHVGHINSSRDKLNEEGIQKLRLFPKGSVLFPKSGASTFLNHRVLLDVDAYVVSHLAVIIPSEKVAPEYLLCHLATVNARDLMQDANYPALRTTEISNIEIPLPPLSVQRDIVARLERELGAVEKVTKAFEELERAAEGEFKAELKETFEETGGGNDLTQRRRDAEVRRVKLGDVCETGSGGTPLKSHHEYYDGGNIPWLRSGEVCCRDIERAELCITQNGLNNSSAKVFPKGSVLVAMYGATAGQVGILRFEASTNQAICAILPNDDYTPEYLYYQLSAKQEEMVAQAVGGAQPNISQIKIQNLEITLPHLTIQSKIAARMDAARMRKERLVAAAKKGKAVAALWRKVILKEAFA